MCADGRLNVPGNRLELNGRIAATLAAPVLMVLDAGDDISVDDLIDKALLSKNGLEEQRCEVLGLIVNKASLRLRKYAPYTPQQASRTCMHDHWCCLLAESVKCAG